MSNFTPQEIEEFLQEFFDVVGARQYVGARYVPIFGRAGQDKTEWDDLAPYEPLTVVMHEGVSYVSRQYVPAGVSIYDRAYWFETYRFNAQVEQYRQEVLEYEGMVQDRVPFPDGVTYPRYGEMGQVLSTLADGTTKWEDPVVPSAEQAEQVITDWLDEHPEATTTVQNNSVTDEKLVQQGGILSTVAELETQFDQNVSYRVPFVLRDGATNVQTDVYRRIKYAHIDNAHLGWRINICYTNATDDPSLANYRIMSLINSSNQQYGPIPYDATSGLNKLGDVAIYYDWANHQPRNGINTANYDSTYIEAATIPVNVYDISEQTAANTGTIDMIAPYQEADTETLEMLRSYDVTPIEATSSVSDRYISDSGTFDTNAQTYVSFYPVTGGKIYRVSGYGMRFDHPTYGFILTNSVSARCQWVSDKVTLLDYYNLEDTFLAPDDGYVVITHFDSETSKFTVSEAVSAAVVRYGVLEDALRASFVGDYGDAITPTETGNGYYINTPTGGTTEGTITRYASAVGTYYVDWYAMGEGDTVVLYGDMALNGALPIATFGSQRTRYDTILFDYSDANVKRVRQLTFTAPYDGILSVAYVMTEGRGKMGVFEPTYSARSVGSMPTLKIQAFGDSITDNEHNTWGGHTTWLDYIEDVVSTHYHATITNSAYGGAALTNKNQYSVVNYVCGNADLGVTSQLDTNADIVMVWAGTNDWASGNTAIGDFDGADTTIKGALQKIIEYVSEHTHAALVVATPMQRYNDSDAAVETRNEYGEVLRNGLTLKDVCDAMQEMCDFYGIDCIRMDKMAGFNRQNIRTYCSDGLHPSTKVANHRIACIFDTEFQRNIH